MRRAILPALLLLLAGVSPAGAQSLRGSPASLDRQNRQASLHDFTYLRTRSQVQKFVGLGLLVPVRPTAEMDMVAVSFPYARPEVKLFIDRLSSQYRAACGEQLVVTSLTRPSANQPRNASPRSVHPTGMALDIRISRTKACRRWLESTLLALERRQVLEATRERRPPHYHVAIYPQQYLTYVGALRRRGEPDAEVRLASAEESSPRDDAVEDADAGADGIDAGAEAIDAGAGVLAAASDGEASPDGEYRVGRGDTLWSIAKQVGTSVERIKAANGLANSRIYAGQKLRLPTASP